MTSLRSKFVVPALLAGTAFLAGCGDSGYPVEQVHKSVDNACKNLEGSACVAAVNRAIPVLISNLVTTEKGMQDVKNICETPIPEVPGLSLTAEHGRQVAHASQCLDAIFNSPRREKESAVLTQNHAGNHAGVMGLQLRMNELNRGWLKP